MADLVSPRDIERIVGARRHSTLHLGRAVSADETVHILHSALCVASGVDLLECRFSVALDRGIDKDDGVWWWNAYDRPVVLGITRDGWLYPDELVDCCDLHGRNCETPSELCCEQCAEWRHPMHDDGSVCVNPDLDPNPRYRPDGDPKRDPGATVEPDTSREDTAL